MATGLTGHDFDRSSWDGQGLGQQFDDGRVRLAIAWRRRNPNLKLFPAVRIQSPGPNSWFGRSWRNPNGDDAAHHSIAMAGAPFAAGLAGRSSNTSGIAAKVSHIMIQKSST